MYFYKFKEIDSGQEVYVNPKAIEYYMYVKDYVQIETSSMYMHVSKSEFINMMMLEGAREYWHTLHTIEFLLTIKTILFY